jgi:dolichyl-phosphate beta-glucosyltransferase
MTDVGEVIDINAHRVHEHSLSLVVPLYNEEERLQESAAALEDFVAAYEEGSELIFVDDGSEDATVEVASELAFDLRVPTQVLARPHLGKGAAVRAGLAMARASVLGFCDVDLSTPLDEVARLVTAAASAPVLAIASRDVVSTQALHRQAGLRGVFHKAFNRLVRATLTPGVYDTQCGAKAAHRAVWKEILPYCAEDGFSWDAEAIAVCRRRGMAVWEVGITWRHDDRTRVRPWRDGALMVASVPRILGRVRQAPSLVAGPSARPIDLFGEGGMFGEDGMGGVLTGPAEQDTSRPKTWPLVRAAMVLTSAGRMP